MISFFFFLSLSLSLSLSFSLSLSLSIYIYIYIYIYISYIFLFSNILFILAITGFFLISLFLVDFFKDSVISFRFHLFSHVLMKSTVISIFLCSQRLMFFSFSDFFRLLDFINPVYLSVFFLIIFSFLYLFWWL